MAEEEVDIDLNDPEVGKAAVKIQAGFKSFMAKKKGTGEGGEESKAEGDEPDGKPSTDDQKKTGDAKLDQALADLNLNCSNVNDIDRAATKIQSTFRDYKTRKEHGIKNNQEEEEDGEEDDK